MKTKLFLLVAILSVSIASAESFKINGINYKIIPNTTTVEVGRNQYTAASVTIPSSVVYNSVTYSVTSIGVSAFSGNKVLTSIVIPNSITSIGKQAFYYCNLTYLAIGDSVATIGEKAFIGCTRLTAVNLPHSVITLEDFAFTGCSALNSLTISNSIIKIGRSAFYGCERLTSVVIPDSATIGSTAFMNCTGLTSLTIGNLIVSMGDSVFEGCTGLTSILIPDSFTSIAEYTFKNCTGLTSVTIPNSVKSIGVGAFNGCTGLTSVTIPNSVTSIGAIAFYDCTSLTTVNCAIDVPLHIDANVFLEVNQATCALNVPPASVNAYKAAAVWKYFNPINGILSNEDFVNKTKIKLYPNPVSNNLTIENPVSGNYQLQVINQLGQLVLKQNQNTSSTSLDVSNLTKGLYFLNLDPRDGKTQTAKFIKN